MCLDTLSGSPPLNPLLQCWWLESVSELAKLIRRQRCRTKRTPNIEAGGPGKTNPHERSQAQSYFTGEISSVTSSPGNLCFWVLEGLLSLSFSHPLLGRGKGNLEEIFEKCTAFPPFGAPTLATTFARKCRRILRKIRLMR